MVKNINVGICEEVLVPLIDCIVLTFLIRNKKKGIEAKDIMNIPGKNKSIVVTLIKLPA